MNPERDTAGAVRVWLHEDATDNADRVLDAVLAELDATPQRRPRSFGDGFRTMKAAWLGYGLAAISLVVAATLGLSLLSHRVASPPTRSVSPTPVASPAVSPPPRLPGTPVQGGRYTLAASLGITVEAPPSGWDGTCCPGDPMIFKEADIPAFAAFRFADASLMVVYEDPCNWSQSETQQPSGAAAIAAALSALPGRSGTEPESVIVGGTAAVHVRLKVPDNADFGGCYGHQYRTWNTLIGDPRDQEAPGQIDDIYLVDIGPKTVVFDLGYFPETSKADRRALTAMLDSIRIQPPVSP